MQWSAGGGRPHVQRLRLGLGNSYPEPKYCDDYDARKGRR